jgi:hypothetical protein
MVIKVSLDPDQSHKWLARSDRNERLIVSSLVSGTIEMLQGVCISAVLVKIRIQLRIV